MNAGAKTDCPACGSSRTSRARVVPDHEYGIPFQAMYLSCEDCGTAIQAPMPSPSRLSSFYPSTYHSQANRGLLHRLRCRMRLRQLLPLPLQDGVVLDYGCGNGAFLDYAAATLSDVRFVGYEIRPRRTVKTLQDGRVTLIEGSFEDLLDLLPPCRLITMNHVIEHLPDPAAVMTALFKKLQPGGVLEGQTPAAGSLEQRVFGGRWSGYHAPRHTVIFSRRGLGEFLTRLGFRQPALTAAFNPAGLAVSLASAMKPTSGAAGIARRGPLWLLWLGLGTLLAPFDVLSGAPGIVNFRAVKGT